MRYLILILLLSLLPMTVRAAHPPEMSCATCYGDHDCRACHTCGYCAHCNSSAPDKCDVFYRAQGLTPPWEKKAAKVAAAHHPSTHHLRKRRRSQ